MSDMIGQFPRWNLDPVAPPPGSTEFTDAVAAVAQGIAGLTALFDEREGRRHDRTALGDSGVANVDAIILRYNDLLEAAESLEHGLVCRVFTDASDTQAQGALSELEPHLGRLAHVGARFVAWAGSHDVEALIERSVIARDHAAALRRAHRAAAHLMTPAEEELAAELGAAGSRAWFRLRQEVEANLTA
jgi:oligoendopeptidase F